MSLVLSGTDGLSDVDGTVAAPAIRGTDANTGIFFPAADTIAFAEGGAEAMRIDSDGDVGIGTTTPGKKLDILSNTSQDGIRISGSANPRLTIIDTTTPVQFDALCTDTEAILRTDTNHPLVFSTNGTERARITSSGDFYIGVTSLPSAGSGGAGFRADSNGRKNLYLSTSTTSVNGLLYFNNPNGEVGSVTTTGSATAYNTSSDYRLKEAIAPMTGALAKVALLKPCTYKWKVDGSDGQGFIAHELDEVVPGCVSGEKDAVEEQQYEVTPAVKDEEGRIVTEAVMGTRTVPKYQGIDTSFLVATLTAALQEAHGLIKNLEQRVAALEAA